jgi:hypothetical protein
MIIILSLAVNLHLYDETTRRGAAINVTPAFCTTWLPVPLFLCLRNENDIEEGGEGCLSARVPGSNPVHHLKKTFWTELIAYLTFTTYLVYETTRTASETPRVCIRCFGNLFTRPLTTNGHSFRLHYSGFQTMGYAQAYTQQGDLIWFQLFFQNKKSWLKINLRLKEVVLASKYATQNWLCPNLVTCLTHLKPKIRHNRYIDPYILNRGNICRWTDRFTLRPFYLPGEKVCAGENNQIQIILLNQLFYLRERYSSLSITTVYGLDGWSPVPGKGPSSLLSNDYRGLFSRE